MTSEARSLVLSVISVVVLAAVLLACSNEVTSTSDSPRDAARGAATAYTLGNRPVSGSTLDTAQRQACAGYLSFIATMERYRVIPVPSSYVAVQGMLVDESATFLQYSSALQIQADPAEAKDFVEASAAAQSMSSTMLALIPQLKVGVRGTYVLSAAGQRSYELAYRNLLRPLLPLGSVCG
jgi:hypothetical protein